MSAPAEHNQANSIPVAEAPRIHANGHDATVPTSPAALRASLSEMPSTQGRRFNENGRYLRILIFFGRIILQVIWWDLLVARMPFVGTAVRRRRPVRFRKWARRFRTLAVDMGGVMIKLGQFLSARVDVLPPEVTEELQGLQDEVPAENPAQMLAVAEQELGPLSERFAYIEETPLAAASLGQAHRAWLLPQNGSSDRGEAVVIKIQRPHIENIVRTDLSALRIVARWIMRYRPIGRRADVPALMEEFAETLWEELDYESEADNAERFATHYANSEHVYIPAVYRRHSTKRVIVLENVESIKITDVDGMIAAHIDPKEVAEVLLTTYFEQVFQEGFFHADPHPGNLFIRPREDIPWQPHLDSEGNPAWGRPFWLIFIDFGMVGHVPNLIGENLRKMLISVTTQNAEQLTEAYNNMGFFLPGADLERITEAQRVVLERIYGRNLLELARPDPNEVQELGAEFRDLLFDFPFQVPQDFIYLGRAIGMTSGLVSQLDEQINPWYFIEKFGRELISNQEARPFTLETALELIKPYLATPGRVRRIIQDAEQGRLRVQSVPDKESIRRQERLEKRISQLSLSILGAAGMVSATLLYLQRKREMNNE
ncbi:MAG: AarF/ABC1/UbiB kinase family protein [Anaerolineales bacterium]|nr:AarF/ABC1/UbiB kinase family protein [Anaerolineales bacterium]